MTQGNNFEDWSPSFMGPPTGPLRQEDLPVQPDLPRPPRWSGRTRVPATRPDNVYRNRPPVDILGDDNEDPFASRLVNQRPDTSHSPRRNGPPMSLDLAKMVQDGGAKIMNFLLSAAVSSTESAKGQIPMFPESENDNTET